MSVGPSWVQAFVVASILALTATPLVRRLAVGTAFVDHPGDHKSHARATPYLGGMALAVAVLVAFLFAPSPPFEVAVVALGAALMATTGLLDDHRTVPPGLRFLVEIVIAVMVVAVGLRVHATGVVGLDAVITIVWIVGVTNAVNLLDNMDGLAAGTTAAAGSAILLLAVLGAQSTTAVIAAGLVGACLGFLAYNRPPASIFMGDTGSLFLGFVLAVLTIDVNPALVPPASFIVPVMLLALPVLDTVTVVFARVRRGLNPAQGGRDHLSHRLVAQGLSRGWAVSVLVITEAAVGALAVAAGRNTLSLSTAVVAAAVVLATLAAFTARASVYAQPVVGMPRTLIVGLTGVGIVVPIVASPAVIAVGQAQSATKTGAQQVARSVDALEAGDTGRARIALQQASGALDKADAYLDAPLTWLGLGVPGVASNLRASRAIVAVGRRMESAAGLGAVAEYRQLALGGRALPDDVRRRAGALRDTSTLVKALAADLNAAERPYLLPEIGEAVRLLNAELSHFAATLDETVVLLRNQAGAGP